MRLFLQIKIGNPKDAAEDVSFLHLASSLTNDMMSSDIDGDSEVVVTDIVLRLIEKVQTVLVLVMIHDSRASYEGAARVLEHLSDQTKVIVFGDHTEEDTLFYGLGEKLTRVNKIEEIKRAIVGFAQ